MLYVQFSAVFAYFQSPSYFELQPDIQKRLVFLEDLLICYRRCLRFTLGCEVDPGEYSLLSCIALVIRNSYRFHFTSQRSAWCKPV